MNRVVYDPCRMKVSSGSQYTVFAKLQRAASKRAMDNQGESMEMYGWPEVKHDSRLNLKGSPDARSNAIVHGILSQVFPATPVGDIYAKMAQYATEDVDPSVMVSELAELAKPLAHCSTSMELEDGSLRDLLKLKTHSATGFAVMMFGAHGNLESMGSSVRSHQ